MDPELPNPLTPERRWHPVAATDRRVLGVLVEKAKTTPDAYPLSLNALLSGCNQKSNRQPLLQLSEEDASQSLTRLREAGAVAEVQGSGRVSRYRHYLYEWLGVDKVELAVMAELLLRGAQTEGELRGRAARMEPIADLNALRPVLASLKAKGLVVALSPEGRGHVVAHALYEPQEFEELRGAHAGAPSPAASAAPERTAPGPARAAAPELRQQLEEHTALIAQLRSDLDALAARVDEHMQGLKHAPPERPIHRF